MATVNPRTILAAVCCVAFVIGCNQATDPPKPGDDANRPTQPGLAQAHRADAAKPAAAEKPPAAEKPKDEPAVAEKPPAAEKPKDEPAAAEKPPAPEKLKDDPILTSPSAPKGKRLSVWIAQVQADDPMARLEAVTALGYLRYMPATSLNHPSYGEKPPDAVIQALAKALKDSDKTVRFQATGTLQGYGPIGVPAFLEALKDKDADVRENAAGAVGRSSGFFPANRPWRDTAEAAEAAVPALSDVLLKDKDKNVRETAAKALGGFGEPAVPALGEALMKDKDKNVRETAAKALGALGEPAVPTLLKALKTGDKDARRSAVRALARPNGYGSGGKPIPGGNVPRIVLTTIPALAALLKDEDVGLRCDVCKTLWSMGDQAGEAIPALLQASKAQDSGGVAAENALAVIHKAPASAAPALLPFLRDPDPSVRLKAAEALCAAGESDKDCLPVLVELVGRRDSKIRQGAAVVLFQYGSAAKDAVPALIEVVRNDPDPKTRIAAINALGAVGPEAKAALPALKAIQDDMKKQSDDLKKQNEERKKQWDAIKGPKSVFQPYYNPYPPDFQVGAAAQAALKKIDQ